MNIKVEQAFKELVQIISIDDKKQRLEKVHDWINDHHFKYGYQYRQSNRELLHVGDNNRALIKENLTLQLAKYLLEHCDFQFEEKDLHDGRLTSLEIWIVR